MSPKLPDLPIREALPALQAALAQHSAAVLAAPAGSGKTTIVPLALLDAPWLQGKRIVVLEPRRLAARAAAARMATLLGERVGETVGYQIRFERKLGPHTRIEVITEGLLTRRLQSDPELRGVGLVVFDEFHERSLDVDLALALALDAQEHLNPQLRLLAMSATLETERVAALLGGAPVVQASGRLFPVDVRYASPRAGVLVEAAVADGVARAFAETQGDILAFLPGGREIRFAQRALEQRLRGASVHPLYGDLASDEQDAALRPAADGRRKVILATNIAQTSLTVEGVTTVVDGGYARVARFDRGSGANRLETVRISRAAAEQRAGRAGRLGPGACYRLWSEEQHGRLPAQDTPEILSADLSRFALELAAWGVRDPAALRLLDLPRPAEWESVQALLRALEAVDAAGKVTAAGRELARLPVAPRIGHMLLRAREERLLGTAIRVAALLEERDDGPLDLADQLAAKDMSFRVRQVVEQLQRVMAVGAEARTIEPAACGRATGWAYPERIARRREGRAGNYLCADGGEARVPERETLAHQEWIAIAHWQPEPPRRVRLAASLTLAEIERDHAGRIATETVVHWDSETAAVVAEAQRRLGAIVLSARPLRDADPAQLRTAMLAGVRALGLDALPWNEGLRQWQARVLSLRTWRPAERWPDVSDAALAADFSWLEPYLDGVTRRDHLARVDLRASLAALLEPALARKLDTLAPTHVGVPSGSRVALEYFPDGRAPALAVKLQELFGLTRTPAVNEGRTPVVLHLLSPARRPVGVTQDLASFWVRTYPEVRRELKGRYPKHPWPDDPLSAPPTARTSRRPIR